MSVTLELSPEVEAALLVQARARGVSLELLLTQIAQEHSQVVAPPSLPHEQWEREIDDLLAGLPDVPVLPDEAMQREAWYSERG